MTSPLTSHTTPHFSLNISPVEIVTPYLNTSAESLHVSPPSIFLFPTTPPSLQISSTVSTNPPIAPSTAPSTTPSGLLPFYQPCDKLKHKTLDQYLFEEEFVADSPLVETHDSTSNHAAGYSPSATTSLGDPI